MRLRRRGEGHEFPAVMPLPPAGSWSVTPLTELTQAQQIRALAADLAVRLVDKDGIPETPEAAAARALDLAAAVFVQWIETGERP